ncbi:TadE family type IV pilus minor pilin [Rhodococcus sp. NPDC058505]|uniref:TadE family type IV pilus minor pilin n=1 Tax=Rhodococcus sp. NPDC058505 TaxID=3346531 RepID=UPI003665A304
MTRARTPVLDDRGAVTVEAAIALSAIVVVVMLCVAAVLAVTAQVRCIDAAREAARLAARGDRDRAVPVARRVAPAGARIDLQEAGGLVTVRVRVDAALLPALEVSAEAVAVLEESAPAEGPG